MKNCNFCLENDNLKGEMLAEGRLMYVVESMGEQPKYGAMIIPKRHAETPFEMSEEEWLEAKKLLIKTKEIFDRHFPDGYNIGWNVGKAAGQNVNHAHLHIFARFKGEELEGKGIRHAFKNQKQPL